MQIIKGSYGGRQTVIGYLRMCHLIRRRERAAFRSAQKERLYSAISDASEEIGKMRKSAEDSVGEEHGEIFVVYLNILSSEALSRELHRLIDSGESPEEAIRSLITDSAAPLEGEFSLCHVREALDILLGVLEDVETPKKATAGDMNDDNGSFIYVSDGESLLPLLSGMSKKEVSKSSFAGVVCLTVSELTAALTLGIPAILIDGNVVPDDEWEGITAILDCRRKRLVLAPDLSELERYSEQGRESEYRSEELERLADKLSVTLSGRRIYLASELRRGMKLSGYHLSGGDAETLLVTDGADAGMDLAGFEEDQYSLFKRSAASDAEVTVRLLGMPSDGGGSFARSGILGLRGAGLFALFRPVYKAQLRAILRGSAHGGISVLLPDVCCEGELGHFRSMLREARGELKGEGGPIGEIKRFGIELSTPAAILESEKLTQGADIVVIDIDRLAGLVSASELIDPIAEDQLRAGIPSVLRLCRQAIDGIRVGGRRFGIRGSLAAEPELTAALIECGFDSFFLPPDAVLPVKERVLTCGGH